MGPQVNFLISKAIQSIQANNFDSAELYLHQAYKVAPKNHDVLRFLALVAFNKNQYQAALDFINKAISVSPRNGVAYSNKGNILLALGRPEEAIEAHQKAIQMQPSYAEAYSNLGNALQEKYEYLQAINLYKKALSIDPNNLDFVCNLGNCFWKANLFSEAIEAYRRALEIYPNHPVPSFYLAQLQLFLCQFKSGWSAYGSRWLVKECASKPLKTSRPLWNGQPFLGTLYIWAEQGIGDQILHASMLRDLSKHSQKCIVSVDKKLVNIFQRSFPNIQFIDKNTELLEGEYDQQIPIASLGQFFRTDLDSFSENRSPYLLANSLLGIKNNSNSTIICGISWRSNYGFMGKYKSMELRDLDKLLELKNVDFVNLQYGDVKNEILQTHSNQDISLRAIEDLDLYNDIESAMGLIQACDIVVTTSNSTAHMAGALGKETLLLLPFSAGKFWYWHDLNGLSLWYPSVRVFKQLHQGDWTEPVARAKQYLEERFAI